MRPGRGKQRAKNLHADNLEWDRRQTGPDLDAKKEAYLLVTGKIARDGPNLSSGKTFRNWFSVIKAEWEHLTVRLEAK